MAQSCREPLLEARSICSIAVREVCEVEWLPCGEEPEDRFSFARSHTAALPGKSLQLR